MPGIVIEPRRLVYWPVPKCASTAIKTAIAARLGITYGGTVHDAPFTWTDAPLPGYDSFAVVRHPARRLYSLWGNKIAPGHPIGPRYVDGLDVNVFGRHPDRFRVGMEFTEFAEAVVSIPAGDADPHWSPQASQVPEGATWMQMEDVGPLLRLLLPELNASHLGGGNGRADETGSVLPLISAYYEDDFRRFGYA